MILELFLVFSHHDNFINQKRHVSLVVSVWYETSTTHDLCCDPDATIWKLDGSPKGSHAKLLCKLTSIKLCFFRQPNQAQKPMNRSYSKMPRLTQCKQNTDFALMGMLREFIHQFGQKFSQKPLNLALDSKTQTQFRRCRDAAEVEAEGTKTMNKRE